MYEDAFRAHGDSAKSVLWPKGRQEERFNALTKYIRNNKGFSVLDYGCGLGHLKEYLDGRYNGVNYSGTDIVPEFIKTVKKKYPGSEFLFTNSHLKVTKNYDYIISSGAFNILYVDDKEQHKKIIFEILSHLFLKCTIYLSVNFMTDSVDFQQKGAYHQNVFELYNFVFANLSKRFVIDQSYMPYEYTITIFKNHDIIRSENIYAE